METTHDILDQIRTHGADAYPEEGCGFLLGTVTNDGENRVSAIQRATNRQSQNRTHRYQLTAEDYRDADVAARAQGLDVVGVYHSHPDHPARPSETDLEEATFPGYTYVIVSVDGGSPKNVTAWALASDRSEFNREEITVTSPEPV